MVDSFGICSWYIGFYDWSWWWDYYCSNFNIFGFSSTVAASNSLFAAFSNSIASTISYSKQKRIEYSLGLKLGLLAIPGTILGAIISTDVTPDIFKILFGFVLIASSVYIFLRKQIESRQKIIFKTINYFYHWI